METKTKLVYEDLRRRLNVMKTLLEKKKWQKESAEKAFMKCLEASTMEEAMLKLAELKPKAEKASKELEKLKKQFDELSIKLEGK